ncbi:hypothetical protein PLICRDRAFT_170855 [Plicaturopsis crispa FD-325 SS-3]|nr:hypothetical protein PLICRDRAFT_170855 [Plicaturopsis crispa FD-325 SS-3]
MNKDTARWPWWTKVSAERAQQYLEDTENGDFDLKDVELKWRDLHPTLRQRGYRLRPRYNTDWKPSWVGTNIDPYWCEDSIAPEEYNVMDATRNDGLVVAIKRIDLRPNNDELGIACLLSSPALRSNSLNHCVPILDVFRDPIIQSRTYLVMPILRPFNEPAFQLHGEIVDFVSQTLQGLLFMHEQHVAHLDCGALNIMMDATALYPQGWHPWRLNYAPNAITKVSPVASRIDHPVRYYFIDYGLSIRFFEGESSIIRTRGGIPQEKTVPELLVDAPYDAYKVDIYILGCVYRKELYEKFTGLDFLSPLIADMTHPDPSRRPTSAEALAQFRRIQAQLDSSSARWPLHPVDEILPVRVVRDTVAAAKGGISSIMRFVGQQ